MRSSYDHQLTTTTDTTSMETTIEAFVLGG